MNRASSATLVQAPRRAEGFGQGWWAAAVYVLLGMIYTYPLVTDLATLIPGRGPDAMQFIWGIWHWKKVLATGGHPFFTHDLYYPLRISLLMHTWSPAKTLLLVPFSLAVNDIFAYNAGFLLTFGLRGWGAFRMLKTFGIDDRAAFLGGLFYTLAPFQMAHGMGHFHSISNEAIPWMIYLWRRPAGVRWEWGRQAGLVAWGLYLFFSDYQGFLFLGLLIAGYVLYLLWKDRGQLVPFLLKLAPSALGLAALLGYFIWQMLAEMKQFNLLALHTGGWGGAEYFALDAAGVLFPSELHPLWGRLAHQLGETLRITGSDTLGGNAAERVASLGWTTLTVIILGRRGWWPEAGARRWLWMGVGFWLFALGPFVRLFGLPLNVIPGFVFYDLKGFGEVTWPAPYALIHYLPLLNGIREPARFVFLPLLATTVLFGLSCQALRQRFWLILGLLLFEFLTVPYPVNSTAREMPAYRAIRQDPDRTRAVLDMPTSPWVKQARPFLFQTYHEHPLIGGNTSRESFLQLQYKKQYAILGQLMRAEPIESPRELRRVFNELSIGYLVCREEKVSRLLADLQRDLPELKPLAPWNPAEPIQVWSFYPAPEPEKPLK
ncbi:MAG: hypothetical protein AB1439_08275 [candidate division FCPU426 bacterium]